MDVWVVDAEALVQRQRRVVASVAPQGFVGNIEPFGLQRKVEELFECLEQGSLSVRMINLLVENRLEAAKLF